VATEREIPCESLDFGELELILIERVARLFRDMLREPR
jgi:hypothetical protein